MTGSYSYHRVTHAQVSDLPEALQDLDDAEQRVQAASDLVSWLIRNARYEVDDEGQPTDTDLIALLKDATVTQAVFADDKYGGQDDTTDEDVVPVALGALRVEAPDTSNRNPNWGTRVWQNISPATWYMLRNAGLIRGHVRSL
jgi:hypothetical protein